MIFDLKKSLTEQYKINIPVNQANEEKWRICQSTSTAIPDCGIKVRNSNALCLCPGLDMGHDQKKSID